MAWPEQIREDVLVACGRRCALCTVFVGSHIELAHIQARAEGGPYTFDNCIPLCFDCHADVGHYNPAQPKGNRYKPSELVRQRDRLYQQVASDILPKSPTATATASVSVSVVDRELFGYIRRLLPPSIVGRFLREHDFAAQFEDSAWAAIIDYLRQAADDDSCFVDAGLEALRQNLNKSLGKLMRVAFGKVWAATQPRWLGVPDEWTDPTHVRHNDYWPAVDVLNESSRRAANSYSALFRECRLRLDVP